MLIQSRCHKKALVLTGITKGEGPGDMSVDEEQVCPKVVYINGALYKLGQLSKIFVQI